MPQPTAGMVHVNAPLTNISVAYMQSRDEYIADKVVFNGTGEDPDGKIRQYEWDFDGDGEYDYSSSKTGRVEYSYQKRGKYKAKLRVTTHDGDVAESSREVKVVTK